MSADVDAVVNGRLRCVAYRDSSSSPSLKNPNGPLMVKLSTHGVMLEISEEEWLVLVNMIEGVCIS